MIITDVQKDNIYREYHGKVYRYILSRLNNEHDTEDLCADVFLKIYEKLESFDETKASLSTWIYTITRNTLTDYYRTRKVFEEISEAQSGDDCVEDEICNTETLETLAVALENLDERERDIIILRFYFGKTLKEISMQMNISYAYVKVLQKKALNKMKNFFDNQ